MKRVTVWWLATVSLVAAGGTFEAGQVGSSAGVPAVSDSRTVARQAPAGPIGLGYETLGVPKFGQPIDVRITVYSSRPVTSLSARVYGHEGLVILPLGFEVWHRQDPGSVGRILSVTPYVTGSLRFSILVQGEIDGATQAAQLTVPIEVGGENLEPAHTGTLSTDESGTVIISWPALER